MSEFNYDGISKLARDLPGQVEFNRRKNVEQDQRLSTLSSQVAELITQVPAGFLPKVYYGLTRGSQTYRFISENVFNIVGLIGNIGDAFELLSPTETQSYISAIAIKTDSNQITIAIQGDYNLNVSSFTLVNMVTGATMSVTLTSPLSLQDASYLGDYNAQDNKGKQITVLYDLESNEENVIYASVDFNNDEIFNWIRIGGYQNGINGKSLFSVNLATAPTIFGIAVVGDSVVATEDFVYDGITFTLGEVFQIDIVSPLTLTSVGSLRGATGDTGATGAPGSPGQNGLTPEIISNNWYIGGVDTGVQALGVNGTNGVNGQSFQMHSGLYSTPANYGDPDNVGAGGETLLQLPTLPQASGMTGYAYVVYDPLTTPLDPFYDLYYCNDNDNDWTIIHPFSGLKGTDGTDGYTPYIYNNNWYINGVNTGVQATGDTGAQGEQGWGFYPRTANAIMLAMISGARVGDYILNASTVNLQLLGTSTRQPGDIIKATGAMSGTVVGNIRGPKGDPGDTGATGATPVITGAATIDNNVGTPSVSVVKTGTDAAPTLTFNFSNLKGATGSTGATGPGVPSGGTAQQYLKKVDSTNYNTAWESADSTPTNGSTKLITSGGVYTALLNKFPVGSIYMSVDSTSPAGFIGGTWVQLKDRFLLGAGDTYSNGATGGSTTHSHNLNPSNAIANVQWDSQSNRLYLQEIEKNFYTANYYVQGSSSNTTSQGCYYGTGLQGKTETESTLPPYLVVYMWKRTA